MRSQQQQPSLTASSSLTTHLNNSWAQPITRSRYIVCDSPSNWDQQVTERLNELVALPKNWDGYNGRGVLYENASFAENVLKSICEPHHDAPTIIPGNTGDLQLEWHTTHGDLELHIIAPNHVRAWYSILGEHPEEVELELTFCFSKVAEVLEKISERQIAAALAAA